MKNDLSLHNLNVEDATELALERLLWRLLAASGAMHCNGASQTIVTNDELMKLYNTLFITVATTALSTEVKD